LLQNLLQPPSSAAFLSDAAPKCPFASGKNTAVEIFLQPAQAGFVPFVAAVRTQFAINRPAQFAINFPATGYPFIRFKSVGQPAPGGSSP